MAQMTPGFTLIGSISNLSAYKRRGFDTIIVRTKGGPSKEKIKRLSSFENLRKRNVEFGGRSTACSWIRRALNEQLALADYNIAGPLNALLKPIQILDTENEVGRRNVCLSRQPQLLAGFSLNRTYLFDTIVRNPVTFALSRETLSAQVDIPAMLPGFTFQAPGKYPLYSFIAALGVIPDLVFDGVSYAAFPGYNIAGSKAAKSPWYPVLNGSPALRLEINLPTVPPDTAFSIMLSIGIRFGTVAEGGEVQQIKYAGSAKVLAVG